MILFKEIIAVLIGGALGSVFRFLLSRGINMLLPKNFPWGIWTVNIIGCFAMGILAALMLHKEISHTLIRVGLMIGVLGGFTTFSSFSLDTLTLFQNGQPVEAITYVFTSVVFSLAAVYLGFLLIQTITAG